MTSRFAVARTVAYEDLTLTWKTLSRYLTTLGDTRIFVQTCVRSLSVRVVEDDRDFAQSDEEDEDRDADPLPLADGFNTPNGLRIFADMIVDLSLYIKRMPNLISFSLQHTIP